MKIRKFAAYALDCSLQRRAGKCERTMSEFLADVEDVNKIMWEINGLWAAALSRILIGQLENAQTISSHIRDRGETHFKFRLLEKILHSPARRLLPFSIGAFRHFKATIRMLRFWLSSL